MPLLALRGKAPTLRLRDATALIIGLNMVGNGFCIETLVNRNRYPKRKDSV